MPGVVMVAVSIYCAAFASRFGEPEIQHLHRSIRPDLDICRLQIPMHDPLLVRRFERNRNLLRDRNRLFYRNRPSLDPVGERRAFHQLHYQIIRADVVQRANVRMIQRRNGTCLTFEAVRKLLRGDLDCDITTQPRVASSPYFTHSAFADGSLNPIRPQLRTGGCYCDGSAIENYSARAILRQQGFHFAAKIRIGSARFGEKRRPVGGRTLAGVVIDFLDS